VLLNVRSATGPVELNLTTCCLFLTKCQPGTDQTTQKEVISVVEKLFRYKIDHILFWMLTVGFHALTKTGLAEQAGLNQFILEIVIRNGLLAAVIYFNLLIVIPVFLERKRYVVGALLVLSEITFYVLIKNYHDAFLIRNFTTDVAPNFYRAFLYNGSIVVFYLVFSSTLHFTKQWYLQKELIRKIELEKLNTELEYLKAQINPHFLFNSLNTVFFQIDKQNALARETLSKFSDMLRYQLYECNGKEIPVEKEIRYLKNYVELQRLRKDENYDIRFSCADGLTNFTLSPLLLIPFVENAFKHVSHFSDRKNVIEIDVMKTGDQLQLKIFNTKDPRPQTINGGIGLTNVKRRLELLYGGRHTLNVTETPDSFEVTLTLEIT
jgi:two-component system LytT family sensor kinase